MITLAEDPKTDREAILLSLNAFTETVLNYAGRIDKSSENLSHLIGNILK